MQILAKERPDAILPTMGGQTGLNIAKELAESGILDKYGIELIGAKLPSIDRAEDRDLFKQVPPPHTIDAHQQIKDCCVNCPGCSTVALIGRRPSAHMQHGCHASRATCCHMHHMQHGVAQLTIQPNPRLVMLRRSGYQCIAKAHACCVNAKVLQPRSGDTRVAHVWKVM